MRAITSFRRIASAILAVAAMTAAAPPAAAEKVLPSSRADVELSYAPLVKTAAPAVVNIYTRKVVRTRRQAPLFDDPFFRRFFGQNCMPSSPGLRWLYTIS